MAQGTCSIPGCGKTGRVILTWCMAHYTRHARTGSLGSPTIGPGRPKMPPGVVCAAQMCNEPAHCKGYCKAHYSRLDRHGRIDEGTPVRRRGRTPTACSVSKCLEPHTARGYCAAHYQRVTVHGDPRLHIPLAASKSRRRGCAAPDCADPHYIGGHCVRHHYRVSRYGNLDGGKYEYSDLARDRGLPREERFWFRVDRDGPVPRRRPALGPCWIWLLSTNDAGYGQTFLFPEIGVGVHRVAWVLSGCPPLVRGHELDHLCRNVACCRPSHLEQVPKAVNILRGESVPARNARKTRCRNGHDLTGDNVALTSQGHRRCRRCANDKVLRLAAYRALTKTDRAVSRGYRLAIADDPCRYCGDLGAETDHFFPIVKGGTEQWINLGRSCVRCNRSKGSRCGTWFLLRSARRTAVLQPAA